MSVLDRDELEASPLADLHAIASQLGIDGFRRMRREELIAALLGEPAPETESETDTDTSSARARERARPSRARGRGRRGDRGRGGDRGREERDEDADNDDDEGPRGREGEPDRVAEGVVELLGNGSAFLRVDPPAHSEGDVYISAAQVRRCELVSGDRISGPLRAPRRSERYPSLIRIDTINGEAADAVAEGTRYDDLPVSFPSERIELDGEDPTLAAIERMAPLGKGSRATIVGAARAGKTFTLRRIAAVLAGREGIDVTLVLAGVRPEEISEYRDGPVEPVAALSMAASHDAQGQAVERAVETAKRLAARGGDAVVLLDGLDGLHPPVARRVLAAARNIVDGGSLTIVAVSTLPVGGETTVIALDAMTAAASGGGAPALDPLASGTLRPELLVGEEGAAAIARARAEALGRTG